MHAFMANFMRHDEGALGGGADVFRENRAALIIEYGACAFQGGIAARKPSQAQLEMGNRGID